MPDYSPIATIEAVDFMSFRELGVSFDFEEPGANGFKSESILNIKGFNDSGKSALLVAVGVCLLNAYPRKQKTFIRDGQDRFQIAITFQDGISILREKYKDGSSLYEMYNDSGDRLFTTRVGGALTPIEGVPTVIANYLGMFNEGSMSLHMRRRTDPMFLVNTTGAQNYEALNAILKTSELSSAVSTASKAANVAKTEVQNAQYSLQATKDAISEIWATDELVALVRQCSDELDRVSSSLSDLLEVDQTVSSLESIVLVPEEVLESVSGVLKSSEEFSQSSAASSQVLTHIDSAQGIVVVPPLCFSGVDDLIAKSVDLQGKIAVTEHISKDVGNLSKVKTLPHDLFPVLPVRPEALQCLDDTLGIVSSLASCQPSHSGILDQIELPSDAILRCLDDIQGIIEMITVSALNAANSLVDSEVVCPNCGNHFHLHP